MNRRWWWFVVGVVSMVLATACGGGGGRSEEAGVARKDRPAGPASSTTAPSTTAPPTTAAPTANRDPKVTATTEARPQATVTTAPAAPEPDLVVHRCHPLHNSNGVPQVTASPPQAPPGTRVELEGCGFTGEPWQTGGGYLWLSATGGQDSCDLMAQAENNVRVSADGYLTGGFIVPATGVCRFSAGEEMFTLGLDFDIAYQCTACHVGTFTVLHSDREDEPTGDLCGSTAFMGAEDLVGDVYAEGISCEDAHSFLSAHAWAWGPVTGPAQVEADGFSCTRTSRTNVDRPRAAYKCIGDSQTIWFVVSQP